MSRREPGEALNRAKPSGQQMCCSVPGQKFMLRRRVFGYP